MRSWFGRCFSRSLCALGMTTYNEQRQRQVRLQQQLSLKLMAVPAGLWPPTHAPSAAHEWGTRLVAPFEMG
jgi:hypothetical protein